MFDLLQTVGWLASVVYSTIPSFWFLIHPRAAYWRSHRRSPFLILLPAWAGMWLALALLTRPWRHKLLYSAHWTWLPALLFFGIGFWLYLQSSRHFTPAQLGGLPELRTHHPEQRLVTSGIRAHVRHPVYLAHLCEMLAWSLGTGLAVAYLLTGFAMMTGAIMIRMEDRELESRFGSEYAAYRDRVPALLPRLRV